MGALKELLDFIYPPRCQACGKFLRDESAPFCYLCKSNIFLVEHPICIICGTPFISGPDHPCGQCSKKRPPYDRARAAGKYSGTLRPAIIHFKFHGRTSLAKPLGKMMTDTLLKEFDPGDIDSVIPVPLHNKRLRWRGFNQALLLARRISTLTGLWVDPHTLKRIKDTRPQTRLPFKERPENVKGAFAVERESFVRDRSILLIDDVTTSGATITECARVLKTAGAEKLEILTLARAALEPGPGDMGQGA